MGGLLERDREAECARESLLDVRLLFSRRRGGLLERESEPLDLRRAALVGGVWFRDRDRDRDRDCELVEDGDALGFRERPVFAAAWRLRGGDGEEVFRRLFGDGARSRDRERRRLLSSYRSSRARGT